MSILPLIIAALLTVTPVTDTGTGTAYAAPAAKVETEAPTAQETSYTTAATTTVPATESDGQLPQNMDESGYLSVVGQNEINMLAYLVDMEIGSGTRIEKEAVVWCVLNRVDKGRSGGFRDTVYGVLTQSGQFRSYYGTGSSESYNIVVDVLTLWMMERQGGYPVSGRVLPRDYCWYHGDGRHNHFRDAYSGGSYWDWSWTGGY